MRLTCFPYRLPLRTPWQSAHGTWNVRRGWLVRVEDADTVGYGDCAPLPAAGTETATRARMRLRDWQHQATALSPAAALARLSAAGPSATPCADGAVETALLDGQARALGVPLRQVLAPAASSQIAVNAALGILDEHTPARLVTARAAGYRTFKCKLGRVPPTAALSQLARLCAELDDGERLRLDVNGAWDETAASAFLAGLRRLERANRAIELIEEPLRAPEDAALARLQAQTDIPLALDETLAARPQPLDVHAVPVRALVLKPAALGGLRPTLAVARAALATGRWVVVTSMLESAAGLWATAQLAAVISAETPTEQTLAHGLATAEWLARDLGPAPQPQHGWIRLPHAPGSGFAFCHAPITYR